MNVVGHTPDNNGPTTVIAEHAAQVSVKIGTNFIFNLWLAVLC